MKFNGTILKQFRAVALVALAPTFVLASERTFVHASALDPSVPPHSSQYLDALGEPFPWWITEVPSQLEPVSLTDRLNIPNLAILYLISFILVATLWALVRGTLYTVAFMRRTVQNS